MSSGLVEECSGAETIADVIDALCVKRAGWERIAEEYRQELNEQQEIADSRRREMLRVGEERDRWAKEARELRAKVDQLNENAERGRRNLAQLDQITLDLYLYIVELAGHRDTAKTKAERIALGHVVERLKQIRGVNEAEAEALS